MPGGREPTARSGKNVKESIIEHPDKDSAAAMATTQDGLT
jgi:hypothetical protein